MRILIYGAGVIGSIFAGKLFSGGHDVTVLARNKRLESLRTEGLKLQNIRGGCVERYPVKTIDSLEPGDTYDYVIVAMQYGQIEKVLPVLSVNRSPNIVLCVNNPNGYGTWKTSLGGRLMTGFPASGGEIADNITHYYISRGFSRLFQTTTFGEPDGSVTERLKTLVGIFNACGIPSVISRRMEVWQTCHLAVVTPIANAILKNGGDLKALSKNTADIGLLIRATRTGFDALKELGYRVEPKKLNFYYMPRFLLTFVFGLVFRTTIAEFSMAKHARNAVTEMKELQEAFETLIKDTKTDKKDIYMLSRYIFDF